MKEKFWFLVSFGAICFILGVLVFKSCRYDWSPHYLENPAVKIHEMLDSPDSSFVLLRYSLDVGARGIRIYNAILSKEELQADLSEFILPVEAIPINWISNDCMEIHFDPNEKYRRGGSIHEFDFAQDSIDFKGIQLVVTKRVPLESY